MDSLETFGSLLKNWNETHEYWIEYRLGWTR